MKINKLLSVLLALVTVVGMIPALGVTVSAGQVSPRTITASTPAELRAAFDEACDGDTVKLTADVVNYDEYFCPIDGADYSYAVVDKNITLDIGTYKLYGGGYDYVNETVLNPLTLDNATVTLVGTTGELSNYEVGNAAVTLKNGSVFNVNGATVKGGNSGDAFLFYDGTANIYGGTVYGNYIDVRPYDGGFESGAINVFGGNVGVYNETVISSAPNDIDFTFYAGLCNVKPETKQLATGSSVTDLGESVYFRYQISHSDSVAKVKLEWEITEVNVTRMDAKKWDANLLKWVDDDENDVVLTQPVTATFKVSNLSDDTMKAEFKYTPAEYETGKSFDPTVAYTGVDATTHDVTLDPGTVTTPTVATVTITVTPGDEDFKKVTATTTATKYGTYSVAITKVEMVTLTFTRTTSSASLSYDGSSYDNGASFSFKVKKNSVVSIVTTGIVGEGPTQTTLTVDGKTVSQYSAAGYPISWFPISNGAIINEDKTICTSACILSGSQVMLADGSTKRIDDVTTADKLMTFNFYDGTLDGNSPMFVMKHENILANVITVTLDNGTTLEMCDWQQFFDMDAKTYFDVDAVNYKEAVGKNVMFIEKGTVTTAKIVHVAMQVRTCTSYEIFTDYNKNFVANGVLTVEPETYLQGVYTIGNDLKIDTEQYQKDVETYGRYTYEAFADMMTKDEFDKMNIADKKIAVGKGIVSEEWLFALYETWMPLYR